MERDTRIRAMIGLADSTTPRWRTQAEEVREWLRRPPPCSHSARDCVVGYAHRLWLWCWWHPFRSISNGTEILLVTGVALTLLITLPYWLEYRAANQAATSGNAHVTSQNYGQALRAYRVAWDSYKELAARYPNDRQYQERLEELLPALVRLHRFLVDGDGACRLLNQEIRDQLTAGRIPQLAVYRSLAETQLLFGSHQEAYTTVKGMLERYPDDLGAQSIAVRFLGICASLTERDRDASAKDVSSKYTAHLERLRDELREQSKNNNVAANELAWSLATCPVERLRRPCEATELAKKAVSSTQGSTPESAPQRGAYLNTLGVAYYRLGEPKYAIGKLEEALQVAERDPEDRFGVKPFSEVFMAMAWRQVVLRISSASTVGLMDSPLGQGPFLAAPVLIPGITDQERLARGYLGRTRQKIKEPLFQDIELKYFLEEAERLAVGR
jgi:tetratricopeptide (TPR) repeat protein